MEYRKRLTKGLILKQKKLEIFLENITLENLFAEYISGGCLELLLNLLVKFDELSKEDESSKRIIDFVLLVLGDLIKLNKKLSFKNVENLLNKASSLKEYAAAQPLLKLIKLNQTGAKINQNTDNSRFGRESKEQNTRQIAQQIARYHQKKEIIIEFVTYLKSNIDQPDQKIIIFILRLLRKLIEIENSNIFNDNPIYMWKELNSLDLKRVEAIQQNYRSLGLSQIIFKLFAIKDHRIFRETLLLSLGYLFGQNSQVQRDFDEKFKSSNRMYAGDEVEVGDSLVNFVQYKLGSLLEVSPYTLEICQYVIEFLSKDE